MSMLPKELLQNQNPSFWNVLREKTLQAVSFSDLIFLNTLRKKASAMGLPQPAHWRKPGAPLRLAIIGGYSFHPLQDLLAHFCAVQGLEVEALWTGDYDNAMSEVLEENSALHAFRPTLVLFWPSERGLELSLASPPEAVQSFVEKKTTELLGLCEKIHARHSAEIILANFIPKAEADPGAYRARAAGSDWNLKKTLNQALGLKAQAYVSILDAEFLACREGLQRARDAKAWFESKQPCALSFLPALAREFAQLALALRAPMKKVLILDLDNTLYGGVVGDDGVNGLELGDTSPRGEAFKAFQKKILSLTERGVLLAVSSKNDHGKAMEVFEKHPEMLIRKEHCVSFKANWEPKPDNISAIARELDLGLDSFVFADDNAAEIEAVRQFLPQVAAVHLGDDPSDFIPRLFNAGYFSPQRLTAEDGRKTEQYQMRARAQSYGDALGAVTDMDAYLSSLEMKAEIRPFQESDVPRISQLINKSNQFNLTTIRRTEAEVGATLESQSHLGFSVRLRDRFGDHGLISVVILEKKQDSLDIDTWLMSCRVLKRQVEEEVLNEMVRLAKQQKKNNVTGRYLPTPKNGLVEDLLPRLGFSLVSGSDSPFVREYAYRIAQDYKPIPTHIQKEAMQ